MAEVVPTDPGTASTTIGVAHAAAAEMTRWLRSDADRHWHRHRPYTQSGDRAVDADRVPAAQGGVADRQYFTRWVGSVLQRHLQYRRHGQGTLLSDAAAGDRVVADEREVLHGQPMVRPMLELASQAESPLSASAIDGTHRCSRRLHFACRTQRAARRPGGLRNLRACVRREAKPIDGLTNARVASALFRTRDVAGRCTRHGTEEIAGYVAAHNRRPYQWHDHRRGHHRNLTRAQDFA